MNKDTKVIELQNLNEYRIETQEKVKITLLSGRAEILGMELLKDRTYETGSTFVFTYHTAEVRIEGRHFGYATRDTNLPEILRFAERRGVWQLKGSGKSTFLKILMNYMVRLHKKLLVTELDPASGIVCPPLIVGAVMATRPFLELEDGPLLYYYGSKEINNREMYTTLKNKLLGNYSAKCDLNIVLAPEGEEHDNILVLNDERMFYKASCRHKEYIRKTGGYQKTEKSWQERLGFYFYGSNTLTPFILNWGSRIYRLGDEFQTPTSALPLGSERKISEKELFPVECQKGTVVAISSARKNDDIYPVKGYAVVAEVNPLKLLFPQSKAPIGDMLLYTDLKYSFD